MILSSILCLGALLGIPSRYVGQTVPENWTTPAGFTKKVVALSFDDGPSALYTEPIINTLNSNNVPATFFIVGNQAQQRPQFMKLLTKFELANHTYNHYSNPSQELGLTEFKSTHHILNEYQEPHSLLFRPPYGQRNASPSVYARSIGYACVLWTNDSHDWELADPLLVFNYVGSQMKPGDIVLMHDNRSCTPQALPNIIQLYRQQGYTFVTVSQMLWEWDEYLSTTE